MLDQPAAGLHQRLLQAGQRNLWRRLVLPKKIENWSPRL
jgi:hypothetical protein